MAKLKACPRPAPRPVMTSFIFNVLAVIIISLTSNCKNTLNGINGINKLISRDGELDAMLRSSPLRFYKACTLTQVSVKVNWKSSVSVNRKRFITVGKCFRGALLFRKKSSSTFPFFLSTVRLCCAPSLVCASLPADACCTLKLENPAFT